MENTARKYYNTVACSGARVGTVGANSINILKLRFPAYDADKKELCNKFYTMFLTEENNDRNKEILLHLGVENVPEQVKPDSVKDLRGLGLRTVDLVAETTNDGYENIKFINAPNYGVRVFDME